jgi:hypothetical protein
VNHRILAREAREAQGHLGWLEAHAELIAKRANDDVDDTLTSSFVGGGRSTSDLTQPERHAGRRIATGGDPVAAAMLSLVRELVAAQRAAQAARRAGARILAEPE